MILLIVLLTMAGMGVITATGFVVLAFILLIAISRMVAEGGLLFVQAPMYPQAFMVGTLGPAAFSQASLLLLGFNFIWMGDYRTQFMPYLTNSLKMGDSMKSISKKWLLAGITASVLLSIVISFIFLLNLGHNKQGINIEEIPWNRWYFTGMPTEGIDFSMEAIDRKEGAVRNDAAAKRAGVNASGILFTLSGAGLMGGLIFMYSRFLWWPLNPIGFAFADTYPLLRMWFPICLAWLIKMFILKIWGVKIYKDIKPLFLGFILGDFLGVGLLVVIDVILNLLGVSVLSHMVFFT
jgi:hypothetical protein